MGTEEVGVVSCKYQLRISGICPVVVEETDNVLKQQRMKLGPQLIYDKSRTRVKGMKYGVGNSKILQCTFRLILLEGKRDITCLVAFIVILGMGAHKAIVDLLDVFSKCQPHHVQLDTQSRPSNG